MTQRTESAASLLRQAVKMCEDGVVERALRLAKQAVQVLEAGTDDDEDDSDDGDKPTSDYQKKRLEQRRRMGLGASTARPIRVENDKFIFSAASLAESKAGRVRS